MSTTKRGMIHLNGNLLCAVDTETTGNIPDYHEIWQVCVLPLDANLEPIKDIYPFYAEMKPNYPSRIDYAALSISKVEIIEVMNRALDPVKVSELFETWFEKLGLAFGKKISPLAQNWPYDKPHLQAWLGPQSFETYFIGHYRDTMSSALFLNDKADAYSEPVPFPKVSLKYLASQLRINHFNAHDSLGDCLATAAVYKRMLRHVDFIQTQQKILQLLKPYVKAFETAEECLTRILKGIPDESK